MKKKILSGIFALALLITAGYGVSKSMNGNADLSVLALSNVEALAGIEIPWICNDMVIDICVIEFEDTWYGYRYY